MRLLLIAPGGVDPSGTHRVIPVLLDLIERLARRHEVEILLIGQREVRRDFELLGARVHDLGPPLLQRPGFHLSSRIAQGLAVLGRGRPDLVHAIWAGQSGAVAASLAKVYRRPFVLSIGGGEPVWIPDIGYGGQGRLRSRLVFDGTIRSAQVLTYGSRFVGRLLPAHPHAVEVPLGVDRDRHPPREDGPRSGPLRILVVANLHPVKAPDTVLRTLVQLQRRSMPVSVDWVGYDTMQGRVQIDARALGLEGAINFRGFLTRDELRPLYAQAEVLLSTSRYESQGVALCEAALCSVPVVGTEVGLLHEWGPSMAAVTAIGDADALAEACLSVRRDPEGTRRRAERARDWALAHDADWTTQTFESLYLDALRRPTIK